MAQVGDKRYFVSVVQWTVATEKHPEPVDGAGYAYMFIHNAQERLIAIKATLI